MEKALTLASFACLALLGACRGAPEPLSPDDPPAATVPLAPTPEALLEIGDERGAELFEQQCALCHGAHGGGDGPVAPFLIPPPRDFTTGTFRLVSTLNGVPTDDDLTDVLQRGIPGSAMPSWGWMEEDELRALAAQVRALAVRGAAARLYQERLADLGPSAERSDPAEALAHQNARAEAAKLLEPGPIVPVAPLVEPTEAVLARGAELYRAHCALCHGPDGAGLGQDPEWTDEGWFAWPRDFTAGILHGGASFRDLSERIQAGMPGTPMEPVLFADPEDLSALIRYVQSLIPEDAADALVQRRQTIRVERAPDALPEDPSDDAWAKAGEVEIVLAPLVWSRAAIHSASVSALHDGERLALRIAWPDPTRDQRIPAVSEAADAAAVELSEAVRPPPYGMGAFDAPVELWHWRADRAIDVPGTLDLLERSPHGLGAERLDVEPVYLPAQALSAPSGEVEGARALGPGAVVHGQPAGGVHANAHWSDGTWRVVLLRSLLPRERSALALSPGGRLQIAFAIWNAAESGLAHKSVTLWHALELAD